MSSEISRQFEQLPANLANHLLITLLPLLLGVVITVPLAALAVRRARWRYPLLAVASVIQTIPSLALLALMVPVLVFINTFILSKLFGFTVAELGFYPTVIALTLYSVLPILRNTVTGILDVDPALTEAARGVGMTSFQSLWRVELPLAMPVIVAGVRTATVWTVGIATLATPVGQQCLGNYIFQGLNTRNWTAVLFGCIVAALLAVVLDLLIGGLQRAVEEHKTKLGSVCGALLAVIFIGGIIAPQFVAGSTEYLAGASQYDDSATSNRRRGPIVIGSKSFTEQYILAELLTDRLKAAGISTVKKESLGSTVVFDGLVGSEIDCYVDYTGTIWANHMGHEEPAPGWKVLDEVTGWMSAEHNARLLGAIGFENAYALAMRREQAEELGIKTISDLTKHASALTIGADLEFYDRPEWTALRRAYGITFQNSASFASTFMYEAIRRDEVDVVAAFTTDGRIDTYDLVLLADDRQAIPPYDAVLLLSPEVASDAEVVDALRPLLGTIDNALMRQANDLVDRNQNSKSIDAAAAWLEEQTLGENSR